ASGFAASGTPSGVTASGFPGSGFESAMSSSDGSCVGRAHVGAVEVLEGAGCRGAPLSLVTVAVGAGAVRVLGRRGEAEEAELPDLHARPQLDGQGRDIRELERDMPTEARVDEPRGGVRDQTQPPQR